jgi:hypothetical protein
MTLEEEDQVLRQEVARLTRLYAHLREESSVGFAMA